LFTIGASPRRPQIPQDEHPTISGQSRKKNGDEID
jgi:hypothetical protein